MSATILLVEDEDDLVDVLAYNLEREGYQFKRTAMGKEAIAWASSPPHPDLIILDLMLPDISGIEVCRQLRGAEATRDLPILMLTAKGEEIDRVVGFEVGADDYVVKPFSVRELMLRIRAILKRQSPKTESKDKTQQIGRLRIEPAGHRVWIDEEECKLTALEFRLLNTFISRKGRVQTRETLLSDVWGIEADVNTRTVDTHVKRLREKLGEVGAYIETIRGVGYRFRAADEASS